MSPVTDKSFPRARGIPYLHHLVSTYRGNARPIRRPRHCFYKISMALVGDEGRLAKPGIPHLYRIVITGQRVVPAVGTRVGLTRVAGAAPPREDMYHIPPLLVMTATAPIPSPSNFRLDKEDDGLSRMLLSVYGGVSRHKVSYNIAYAAFHLF